jgi:hypothetical protein
VALLLAAGAAPAQAQEPLGVVLCVPATAYGEIEALNKGGLGHTVNRLHLTQAIFGTYRAQALIVSIRPRTPAPGQPAEIRLPSGWVETIGAMNPNSELSRVSSSGPFVTVQAVQAEQSYALNRTRFLMIPLASLFDLRQLNPGRTLELVHSAQLTSANVPLMVAVVAMDQGNASGLQIPQGVLNTAVLLNTNVRVVNPRAISGGVPVAIIDVNALR